MTRLHLPKPHPLNRVANTPICSCRGVHALLQRIDTCHDARSWIWRNKQQSIGISSITTENSGSTSLPVCNYRAVIIHTCIWYFLVSFDLHSRSIGFHPRTPDMRGDLKEPPTSPLPSIPIFGFLARCSSGR